MTVYRISDLMTISLDGKPLANDQNFEMQKWEQNADVSSNFDLCLTKFNFLLKGGETMMLIK